LLFVGTASAAQLTSRSDTLETSDHAVADVIHTFVFDTATALTPTAGVNSDFSIFFNFPTGTTDDPYDMPNFAAGDATVTGDGGCGNATGFTVNSVTESSNGGQGENDEVILVVQDDDDDAVAIPIGCTFTVTLGLGATAMDNPADNPNANDGAAACTDGGTAADADVCSISIGTSNDTDGDATPTVVDTGDVLVAHISDVTVSVTVEENLTFSINGTLNANCDGTFGAFAGPDTSSAAVDFGNLSTFDTFVHGCQDLAIETNALNGYTVTAQSDTSLQEAGGTEIDSGICDGTCDFNTDDAWATATNNGFAWSCDSVLGAGLCNLTAEITDYKTFACTGADADCNPGTGGEAPHEVFGAAGPSDHAVMVEYKLSVDPTQPAAVYSTQVTYVATPLF
jgi:hypothetical protein